MRLSRLLLLSLIFLLASCGAPRQQVTPPPAPTVPALGELIDRAAPGAVRTIGYLLLLPDGAVLADSLLLGNGDAPAADSAVWVVNPPALPEEGFAEAGAVRYALVAARGNLEGPGQYGPDGRYAFQLDAPTLDPLSVRELTIPLLLQNSGLYENQAVRLDGQLLMRSDSALLVERIGAGGVPADDALQVKLSVPPRDPALDSRLRSAGSGSVRFGAVQITGLWRAGRLYPLLVTPQ